MCISCYLDKSVLSQLLIGNKIGSLEQLAAEPSPSFAKGWNMNGKVRGVPNTAKVKT